jgi:asparagine synthase (glutamine-hydrolysing)
VCGFVAIFNPDGPSIPASVLARMTRTLAHRGPDGEGYAWIPHGGKTTQTWTNPADAPADTTLTGVLLGHRRLAILDPSDRSRQPMATADAAGWIVYNGAIYNYLELKSDLEALGTTFRSGGDTEVLLNAYTRWGEDAVPRFNGMWAFAIWDQPRKRLVVGRDRFGIKPLYYARAGPAWVFASEIKAILQFPGVAVEADDEAIMAFLRDANIDRGAGTIYRGVRAVPPGSLLVLDGHRVAERRYWRLPRRGIPARSAGDLVHDFRSLLDDAVRLRLRADVPIGTMLSGGLDSTSIAALVHARLSRNDGGPLRTFSACWPEAPVLDEEAAIGLLSSSLRLDSHVIRPSPSAVRDLLPLATYHLEQPFSSPVAAVQFMLMREAHRAGVKVVLNGHGSDEILGGYPGAVAPLHLATLLTRGRLGEFLRERRAFDSNAPAGASGLAAACLTAFIGESGRARVARGLRRLPRRRGLLARMPLALPPLPSDASTPEGLSSFDGLLWRLFMEILPKWLRMEDRMSMAHSIESRLPFLDYRVVELAFHLPQALKIHGGYTKYILREAMRPLLPTPIVLERTKRRFSVPLTEWLRGPWRDFVGDLLLTGTPRSARFLDGGYRGRVDRYIGEASGKIDPQALWRVMHTELWMKEYGL